MYSVGWFRVVWQLMSSFFYGVIEGFYGRQWSWQIREDYAVFLAQWGFDCYIYAPKGDALLRSEWRTPYTDNAMDKFRSLAACYHRQNLRWGVGLSPLGLAEVYTEEDKQCLQAKVMQLNELSPDIFCVLFDDERGDVEGLAEQQLRIVDDILAVSTASQHIVCPTYYSFDPVLEEVFGVMPPGYLSTLGRGLPESVGVFWTGSKVISPAYSHQDLCSIEQLIGRKPILWDNYPVNDGRLSSNYLHLRPYEGRPRQLQEWSAGHLVNPMSLANSSKMVLQSLAALYSGQPYDADNEWRRGLDGLANNDLAQALGRDGDFFQRRGLSQLSTQQKADALSCYSSIAHPVAVEVCDWLKGEYHFDPECLTE